ncbi:MAG TPA: sulfite exporter TauE/SafE family protein [Opitutaceae bacterium]
MELAAVNTPAAAFVAGLVTSLHCAGMCGPLACMLAPTRGEQADPTTVNSVYHLSRLGGYAMFGAIAGAIGGVPAGFFRADLVRLFPWVIVAYFVFVALRLGHRLPRLAFLSRVQLRLHGWLRGRSHVQIAAVMGAATPLLPCGPLYFLIALAALSGSALRGVEFMLAFGLGTVPLLWLVQANFGWVRTRLSPIGIARVQTVVAVIAAVVLTWRLRGTLGFAGPEIGNFLCH